MTNTPNKQRRHTKTNIKSTQIEKLLTPQEKTHITKYLIQKILEEGKCTDEKGELTAYAHTYKLQKILKNKGMTDKYTLQLFQKRIGEPIQQELFATLNNNEFALLAAGFKDVPHFNYQEESRKTYFTQHPNITQESINDDHITQVMEHVSQFLYGKTFGQLFGIEGMYPIMLEQKRHNE